MSVAIKQNPYYYKLIEIAGNDQRTLFPVANSLLDRGKTRISPEHADASKLANDLSVLYRQDEKLRKFIPSTTGKAQVEVPKFKGARYL